MLKYFSLFFLGWAATLFAQNANKHLTATIIGSGSPKYSQERSGPSVLISYGNTQVLVDMGNGTQANLEKNNTKIKDIDALLFTHHHLDHNEEFTPIFIKSLLGGNSVFIAGPKPTTTMVRHILEVYKQDIDYRLSKSKRKLSSVIQNVNYKNLDGNQTFYIKDIKVSCTPVHHSIKTLAYRFDAGNQSIVISGDLTYTKELTVLAKNADYLIIDSGGAIQKGVAKKRRNPTGSKTTQKAHVNLKESSLMAQEAMVKHMVLTHFNFTEVDEEATSNEIKKNYKGTIIYAKDLLSIPIVKNSLLKETNNNTTYAIVDTGVTTYYSDKKIITKPLEGQSFYGQDANYIYNEPTYTDNNDGTISDKVTGLMWEKDMGEKLTYEEATIKAKQSNLGGYSDWRVPTIKELYSLILFTGKVKGAQAIKMFIDTNYFNQPLGNKQYGEREIDAQTWSSTQYVGKTMRNDETIFGVNFVDGRIKGYPKYNPRTRQKNKMYFRLVRGNTAYGKNNFVDNGDGTVSDFTTGLMWQKQDDGVARNWENSLAYAENLTLANYSDWRLPNAKELQSIVDYTKSPQTTNSAAINSVFKTTEIKSLRNGVKQYPYYWTSTTHLDGKNPYGNAIYIAFGEAQGKMRNTVMDVHGAGAQRSDPKDGNKNNFPEYFGPQGDVRYTYNYTRAVRSFITVDKKTHQNRANNNNQVELKGRANRKGFFDKLLERMDANNDRKISRNEARGKLKENFSTRDTNKDGYITENEINSK